MPISEHELKPTFPQALFSFEDPGLIPDHYDEWPSVPNFLGTWAIFGWNGGSNTLNYGVDAVSEEQVIFLAEAKKRHFEETIDMYGCTTDIYILKPDGNHQRYYMGRST
jgi:hypothetical protein